MATLKPHRILMATDGSQAAHAALETAVMFPWPDPVRTRVLVARTGWMPTETAEARAAFDRNFETVADAARLALAPRWPKPEIISLNEPPEIAIIAEAARYKASLIVLGWRGYGKFRRLLAGSVSRSVASHARCPVLIVRKAPKSVRRFVLGFDGCPNAELALRFLESLDAKGARVVLVNVVTPHQVPPSVRSLPSSISAPMRREVTALNQEQHEQAQTLLVAAAARLEQSGWKTKSEVRTGEPLACLLKAVGEHRADVLILGARVTSGLERALLGSVANGALDRSPAAVLLVGR